MFFWTGMGFHAIVAFYTRVPGFATVVRGLRQPGGSRARGF